MQLMPPLREALNYRNIIIKNIFEEFWPIFIKPI